jgi:serine/threonine-protein phosphatase 2B catalytic subunit
MTTPTGPTTSRAQQTQAGITQILTKSQLPIPEIDFTQHALEDGSLVSTQERVVKEVQAPAFSKPTDEEFLLPDDGTGTVTGEGGPWEGRKPNHAFLKNHFYREGRLTEEQALFIIQRASEILRNEPNLLEIDAPITGGSSFVLFFCGVDTTLSRM